MGLAIKSRFRTSRLAQKVYVGGMLFCVGIWACMEFKNMWGDKEELSAQLDVTGIDRKLLSSGVELIPGFTGAKCGSNWYYDHKTSNGKEATLKVKSGSAQWATAEKANLNPKPYAQWEADSGGIVYVIASIYLFLGIAIICDNQFTDSLEMICSRYGLNLSPDVAGATFMAAGSSAPELATSFLGVFVAKSAVGLGTILGSAVFNILIIIGSVAILVGEPLKLDYRPVIRDNFFYAVSVILLCVLLAVDDEANLIDTIILLLWYTLYVAFLAFNDYFMNMIFGPPEEEEDEDVPEPGVGIESPMTPKMGTDPALEEEIKPEDIISDQNTASVDEPEEPPPEEPAEPAEPAEPPAEGDGATPTAGAPTGTGRGGSGQAQPEPPASDDAAVDVEMTAAEAEKDAQKGENPLAGTEGEPEEHHPKKKEKMPSYSSGVFKEDEEEEEKGIADHILDCLSCPYIYIFMYTMPACPLPETYPAKNAEGESMEEDDPYEAEWEERYQSSSAEERKKMDKEAYDTLECGQKWYWATFFVSLIHITWISYFMVEFMLKIGCLWGIPDVVMGLTFLAMGTSIPDALGSISVAQDGEGDMAVSNAVGSNVFDICMGLGLPWFIKLAIEAAETCNYIYVYKASQDVLPSIIILLSIIVILFSVFLAGKWILYPWSGYLLFFAYFLFIVYQLLNTYVINKDPIGCYEDESLSTAIRQCCG